MTVVLWSFGSLALGLIVTLSAPRISDGYRIGSCPHINSCSSYQEFYLGLIYGFLCLVVGPRAIWHTCLTITILLLFSQAVEIRFGFGFRDLLQTVPVDPLFLGGIVGTLSFYLARVAIGILKGSLNQG
jgi:hypothetical protein